MGVTNMPNVNRIPYKIEDGKVMYDQFRLMLGFPSNLRKEFEKEVKQKSRENRKYEMGYVKVVDNEYYKIT